MNTNYVTYNETLFCQGLKRYKTEMSWHIRIRKLIHFFPTLRE